MLPKCPVKGYFRATKSGPRIVKKKGVYLTFHPEISLKRVFFFFKSHLFGLLRNYSEFRGYIKHFSGFKGVSKAGKAREKPAKMFGNVGSPQIGGAFKKREHANAYPKEHRVGGGGLTTR